MLFPWNRSEVLITQSMDQFNAAQWALREAGIRYQAKIVGNGGSRGTFLGRIGEKPFYYIYVKKDDEAAAYYQIRKAK